MSLTTPGQLDQHLLVMLVAATVASGAVAAYGSYLPAFYALLFPAIVPYGIASVGGHGLFDHAIAMLVPTYIVAIAALAVRINANFLETLRLRFENLDLAQELRIQKEAAEQANVAKSSFLAAASHDLRQPVHALGMFVGALQGHAMNDEMRHLVEHIGSSVNAMDGLFNSLLDISRLDAGVVDTQIEPFPIPTVACARLPRLCGRKPGKGPQAGIAPLFRNCAYRSGPDRAHPAESCFQCGALYRSWTRCRRLPASKRA
ncbi:MAG: sensor histidine kinase [Methylocella sp.]